MPDTQYVLNKYFLSWIYTTQLYLRVLSFVLAKQPCSLTTRRESWPNREGSFHRKCTRSCPLSCLSWEWAGTYPLSSGTVCRGNEERGQQEPDGPGAARLSGLLGGYFVTLLTSWHHRSSHLYKGNPVGSLFQGHPRSWQIKILHVSFPSIIVWKCLHSLLLHEDAMKFLGNLNRIKKREVETRKKVWL